MIVINTSLSHSWTRGIADINLDKSLLDAFDQYWAIRRLPLKLLVSEVDEATQPDAIELQLVVATQ
jgi:hypothetical protein